MNAIRSEHLFTTALLAILLIGPGRATAQDSRRQKPEEPQQRNQYRDQAESLVQDAQQKDTQSFAGQVSQKQGKFYLEQEFNKNVFELTDAWQAKNFLGEKVRITGVVVDPSKNILRVVAITKIPGSPSRPAQPPACSSKPCS